MKIDEKHLAQLAAVVEAGGVTEGAHLLGLTQPAVSRTLTALEKRLGERLFVPGRRPLVPTVIGRQLAAHGKVILEASRKASEAVRSFHAGSAGTVRIGGVPFFMDAFISQMLGQFQVGQPDISIEQSYGNLPELQAGLRSGQLDLAICPLGVVDPGSELAFTEILPGRNVIAARARHPLFGRKSIHLARSAALSVDRAAARIAAAGGSARHPVVHRRQRIQRPLCGWIAAERAELPA
ncbi:DNA-binding transcriptional regulator, LysR family [Loktanella fryxellensis]|uniref:DNA-binding transcriptional regulator, LysR family n=1 Tax=Loktanella fryxellensis TaxID=245187 RepID=A0A1H8C0W8_9RHOB|nr:LysR family transcriptional regulator [Loktanella fryxellensis]SEM88710.1 DNA-binding transcriptional regulator, LysR family [Loktanella fryxellensis]